MDWSPKNIWYLSLMTLGYIFGELAHFLINTTSKAVAQGKLFICLHYYENHFNYEN